MNLKLTIQCAGLALAALSCGSAFGGDPSPAKTVNYSDLNLHSSAGLAALYQRIEAAAIAVCDLPRGTRQLKLESELKTCRAEATDRAIVQANLPRLQALHRARTGRSVGTGPFADRR